MRGISREKPGTYYRSLQKQSVACDLCESLDLSELHKGDRYGMGLRTVHCNQCGLMFINPRPTPDAMDEFYRNHYRNFYESIEAPTEEYIRSGTFVARAQHVVGRLGATIPLEVNGLFSLLDVAVAEGSFLHEASRAFPNASLLGLEPNQAFAKFAEEHAGAPVFNGTFEDFLASKRDGSDKRKFDVITFNHVLEHFASPKHALMEAKKLLTADGIVYVEVPNAIAGRAIGHLHLAHLFLFCPETLQLLCKACGFDIVHTQTEGLPAKCPSMCVVLKNNSQARNIAPELPRAVIDNNVANFRATLPDASTTRNESRVTANSRSRRRPILRALRALGGIRKRLASTRIPSQTFVLAGPRSGTTWLSKALNAHPQIHCTERRLFGEHADFVDDEGSRAPRLRITLDKYVSATLLHQNLPAASGNALIRSFVKEVQALEVQHSGKRILVDKITPYVGTSDHVARQIREFFPRAAIVYLLRDGRDVATSGVFHWFNKQPDGAPVGDFKEKRKRFFLGIDAARPLARFFTDDEIEEWAQTWAEPLRTMPAMREKHRVMCIRYEDMIEDMSSVLSSLFRFCHANPSQTLIAECIEASSFKTMSQGRQRGENSPGSHIRKGVVGDWKNYFTRRDGRVFHELAGDQLLSFGYETEARWFEPLPDKLSLMRNV